MPKRYEPGETLETDKLGEPILTDGTGQPFVRPEPPPQDASIDDKIAFLRGFALYNDSVTHCADSAFDRVFFHHKKMTDTPTTDIPTTDFTTPPLPSVEDTYKELGYNNMRVLGDRLFVRTHPMEVMYKGLIYIPQKKQDFFGELPNKHQVWATVLAAGPKAVLKRGECCTFHRLHFTWWRKMEDGTYTGWVNEANLLGGVEE